MSSTVFAPLPIGNLGGSNVYLESSAQLNSDVNQLKTLLNVDALAAMNTTVSGNDPVPAAPAQTPESGDSLLNNFEYALDPFGLATKSAATDAAQSMLKGSGPATSIFNALVGNHGNVTARFAALIIGIGLVIGGIFFLRPVQRVVTQTAETARRGVALVS